jgi:hypothetical protein
MYVKALQSCFRVFGGIKYEAEQGGQHASSKYSANLADEGHRSFDPMFFDADKRNRMPLAGRARTIQ